MKINTCTGSVPVVLDGQLAVLVKTLNGHDVGLQLAGHTHQPVQGLGYLNENMLNIGI